MIIYYVYFHREKKILGNKLEITTLNGEDTKRDLVSGKDFF